MRRYRYEVFSSLAGAGLAPGIETRVGVWADAGPPQFSVSLESGAEGCVVPFARPYRSWQEALDAAGDATMTPTYRVDIYAISDWSLAATQQDVTAAGRLIFRGTIEALTATQTDAGWQLAAEVHSLARVPAQTVVQTSLSLAGDTVAVARSLWANYSTAVGWDARNPITSGVVLTSFVRKNTTLLDELRSVMTAAGPTWHALISPVGLLRLIEDTETISTPHELVTGPGVGANAIVNRLAKRAPQAYGVFAAYSSGTNGVVKEPATRRDATDPREIWESIPEQEATGWAQQFVGARVRQLNYVTLAAEVTVFGSRYDIDSIEVGDRFRVTQPHDQRTEMDPTDVNLQTFRAVGYTYDGAAGTVTVQLTEPTPSLTTAMGKGNAFLQRVLRGVLT